LGGPVDGIDMIGSGHGQAASAMAV
jgi:hypothetical protein